MYPSRFLKPHLRKLYTSAILKVAVKKSNHYDSLGITAKATQADVKSAYYKLSKVYHPDRNKDSEDAAQKFRDISEAYEVLGNVKSRKLYDRGLYFDKMGHTDVKVDIPIHKFYKRRDDQARPPTDYGRTTVYDFDEWSKAHYGATLKQGLRFKQREEFRQRRQREIREEIQSERAILLVGILGLIGAYLLVEKDYDNPKKTVAFGDSYVEIPKSD